jgi:Flp pilus assembly protein TadG
MMRRGHAVLPRAASRAADPGRQRGVAALEFSLVCLVFLLISFGIASYGALLVVQQSLSRAAHEGARAMLQASIAPSQSATASAMGCSAANASVAWLNQFRQTLGQGPVLCAPSIQPCTYSSVLTCATVEVTYANYRNYPLIPELVPLGAWLETLFGPGSNWIPLNLTSRGTVQIGATAS